MKSWVIASIVSGTAILSCLGSARLWDRDEPRNAQCAVEMHERNDWIVPTFAGELRGHKPALLYWMQIASYRTFGISEFSARLPSAFCGLASVLLTVLIANRLMNQRVAMWSGIVLGTSLMFVLASRASTPDGPLIFCSTLAIAFYVVFAYSQAASTRQSPTFRVPAFWQWAVIYACCGLAVLAKGPVGLVLPVAIIVFHMTWQLYYSETKQDLADPAEAKGLLNRFGLLAWRLLVTCKQMNLWLAVTMVLVVAGPWYWAVHQQTGGEFSREFFLKHNVGRALSPMESHSGPPIVFYLGTLLMGTYPWSMFSIPIALSAWKAARARPATRPAVALALCWVGTYVLFFSAAATKLPSYLTPCYPGVALLVGYYFAEAIRDDRILHRRLHFAGLMCGILIGLTIALVLIWPVRMLLNLNPILSMTGVCLACGSLAGTFMFLRRQVINSSNAFAIGGIASIIALFGIGPVVVDDHRDELTLLDRYLKKYSRETLIVSGHAEPSWVFYAGGALQESGYDHTQEWLREIEQHLVSNPDHTVLLRERYLLEAQAYLTNRLGPLEVVDQSDGLLPDDRLTLLRHRPSLARRLKNDSSRR